MSHPPSGHTRRKTLLGPKPYFATSCQRQVKTGSSFVHTLPVNTQNFFFFFCHTLPQYQRQVKTIGSFVHTLPVNTHIFFFFATPTKVSAAGKDNWQLCAHLTSKHADFFFFFLPHPTKVSAASKEMHEFCHIQSAAGKGTQDFINTLLVIRKEREQFCSHHASSK